MNFSPFPTPTLVHILMTEISISTIMLQCSTPLSLYIQIWWNNYWQPQNGKVSHVQSEEVMVSNRKKDICDYDAYNFWPWDRSLQEQADWALSLSGHLCRHTNKIQTSFPQSIYSPASQPAVPSLSSQDWDVTLPGLRRRALSLSYIHHFFYSPLTHRLSLFFSFLSFPSTIYRKQIVFNNRTEWQWWNEEVAWSQIWLWDNQTGDWGGSLVSELYALATTIVILYVHITHLYIWEGMTMMVTMKFWHDNVSILDS